MKIRELLQVPKKNKYPSFQNNENDIFQKEILMLIFVKIQEWIIEQMVCEHWKMVSIRNQNFSKSKVGQIK